MREKRENISYPYKFDEERRRKARTYSSQKLYTGLIQMTIIPLVTLSIFHLTSISKNLENFVFTAISESIMDYYWVGGAAFILLLLLVLFLVGLPISYYSGYILKHRYDLSNQSFGEWGKDRVKFLILSLVLATPLILGVFSLGETFPTMWWLYTGVVSFVIVGIFMNSYHIVILPLFFTTEELEDEDLRQRLLALAKKSDVPIVERIIEIKASEKTEEVNAMFGGMGRTKRIFLYDTLLEKFHKKEIEGVVAHEMGHYVNKDILRFIVLEGIEIFLILCIAGVLFTQWGSFDSIASLPLLMLLLVGLYSVVTPFSLAYSRHRERMADAFALDVVGDSEPLISVFNRLSDIDLIEVDPPRIIEILFYSHPPPKKRIAMAERYVNDSARE
jgi:STE24 endopeptidase